MAKKYYHMLITQEKGKPILKIFKTEKAAREDARRGAISGRRSVYCRQDITKPPMPTALYDAKNKDGTEYN